MTIKIAAKYLAIIFLFLSSPGYTNFKFTFNDHSYEVVTTATAWMTAAAAANNKSINNQKGYLARIDSAEENTEIFNQLLANIPSEDFENTAAIDGGGASYVWIGANDMATEGTWIWDNNGDNFWEGDSTGVAVAGLFNNWGTEPDNFTDQDPTGQDAAGIALTQWPLGGGSLGNQGQWNDISKDARLYYIIEFDAIETVTINSGMSDAWFNPDTDGQGFFIAVFPEAQAVSLAWFTYDTELPPSGASANLGDAGHRWLTAVGAITSNQVTMNIELTSGGIFDSAAGNVTRTSPEGSDGTIVLTFNSCSSGTIKYDIPSISRQGTVPIQRVLSDAVPLCETLDATTKQCGLGPLDEPIANCVPEVLESTGDFAQDCVNRINQYRYQCQCLPPLQRWTEGESCANEHAEYDSTNGAHAGFQARICEPQGSAQNECPNYNSTNQVKSSCLQQMWDEGPGDSFALHGHYTNMSSTSYSLVACGLYNTTDGKTWSVQNFK